MSDELDYPPTKPHSKGQTLLILLSGKPCDYPTMELKRDRYVCPRCGCWVPKEGMNDAGALLRELGKAFRGEPR